MYRDSDERGWNRYADGQLCCHGTKSSVRFGKLQSNKPGAWWTGEAHHIDFQCELTALVLHWSVDELEHQPIDRWQHPNRSHRHWCSWNGQLHVHGNRTWRDCDSFGELDVGSQRQWKWKWKWKWKWPNTRLGMFGNNN
ncbi:hypothetical protein KBW71_00345 [Hydrogenophaga aromaticivorans]|uniref:hypothetical protein n=1 Tax=Hydrogenophaga aromaticivorans TaxID=2610898 RepID=UPI001B35CB43|nr:hypothetical protein [Hydrogenophaga aromaticivorans]MBQ0916899.1 hypothetical protein [Hydrogenophaga aromaticivorans]